MRVYCGRDCETLQPIAVEVQGERISNIRPCTDGEAAGVWLAPGFLDIQVNGYAGIDLNGDDCREPDVLRLVQALAAQGTTQFLPTLITADHDALCARLQTVVQARLLYPEVAHAIPAMHLEGPYISPEDGYRGAHPRHAVRPPSLEEFDRLQAAAGGLIRLLTFSPHWTGSADFLRGLVERQVVVAIGHTHATLEQIREAVAAGAQLSTHLGNGIAQELPRHPNALWTQLAEDRLAASLIADGLHVPPDTLRVMLRAKSVDRCVLVSDSVALAGCAPGRYAQPIGGDVTVHDDGAIRMQDSGLLAGASIALRHAIARMATMTGCSLGDAIRMATRNPADLLQLNCGHLHVGGPADFVLFRYTSGQSDLALSQVFVNGHAVTVPLPHKEID